MLSPIRLLCQGHPCPCIVAGSVANILSGNSALPRSQYPSTALRTTALSGRDQSRTLRQSPACARPRAEPRLPARSVNCSRRSAPLAPRRSRFRPVAISAFPFALWHPPKVSTNRGRNVGGGTLSWAKDSNSPSQARHHWRCRTASDRPANICQMPAWRRARRSSYRASTGHPEPPGVVDDDEVSAAFLDEFG